MSACVVVDASVWIAYLRDPGGPLGERVQKLLGEREILMPGLVLAEVLAGARSEGEFGDMLGLLGPLEPLQEEREDWISAASLSAHLRREGKTVPLPDCLLAAQARRMGAELFTLDTDFKRVPGLVLL